MKIKGQKANSAQWSSRIAIDNSLFRNKLIEKMNEFFNNWTTMELEEINDWERERERKRVPDACEFRPWK